MKLWFDFLFTTFIDHLPYFKKRPFFYYKWLFIFQINCAVKDKGFPKSDTVRWLHNGHEIKGRTSFGLTFNHADVFSSGNYSCVPFNQVGMAQPGQTSIRIFSPPNFVQSLPPVSGTHCNCPWEKIPLDVYQDVIMQKQNSMWWIHHMMPPVTYMLFLVKVITPESFLNKSSRNFFCCLSQCEVQKNSTKFILVYLGHKV